jgi:hypothetical protein
MAAKSKTTLSAGIQSAFPDNFTGDITEEVLRDQQQDIVDSMLCLKGVISQTAECPVDFWDAKLAGEYPFNSATVSLAASSTTTQTPSATDTATQITFGAAQNTGADDVMIDAAGKITYNTTGVYFAATQFRVGRSTATATANLVIAYKVNGSWVESISGSIIDNADNTFTVSTSGYHNFTAGDYVEVFMIRDSSGQNDGGIYAFNPVLSGVPDVPSCRTKIVKMVQL